MSDLQLPDNRALRASAVKVANLAQMVNVIAPIMTNKQGLFLQPIYFPIVEYGKQRGNTSLDVWTSATTKKSVRRRAQSRFQSRTTGSITRSRPTR